MTKVTEEVTFKVRIEGQVEMSGRTLTEKTVCLKPQKYKKAAEHVSRAIRSWN